MGVLSLLSIANKNLNRITSGMVILDYFHSTLFHTDVTHRNWIWNYFISHPSSLITAL